MLLERSSRRPRQMQLTSLVDVLCLLLIFFMLSTTFVRTESMELSIPYAGAAKKVARSDVMRIFVGEGGRIFLSENETDQEGLQKALINQLSTKPDQKILVLSADNVSVQELVSVMDLVYLSGGQNMSVVRWQEPQEVAPYGN